MFLFTTLNIHLATETGPNLETYGCVQYWLKRTLFLKKGHFFFLKKGSQKFHQPLFNSFSKCFKLKKFCIILAKVGQHSIVEPKKGLD